MRRQNRRINASLLVSIPLSHSDSLMAGRSGVGVQFIQPPPPQERSRIERTHRTVHQQGEEKYI